MWEMVAMRWAFNHVGYVRSAKVRTAADTGTQLNAIPWRPMLDPKPVQTGTYDGSYLLRDSTPAQADEPEVLRYH